MILEMKRALEDLKSGDKQGYRKIFDATCEEVYCRSILILQKEGRALDFMKVFYTELFGALDEAYDVQDQERWLWLKYYQRMRKQYHKLLAEQEKDGPSSGNVRTLAEIPAALPLLHRIMLVMANRDDFTAGEISGMFGLPEEKTAAELQKVDKFLPALTKNQPENVADYLSNWRVLLLGASRQILSAGSDSWMDQMFQEAIANAGIVLQEEKKDDFDYFVADVDVSSIKPKKKPVPVVEEEEPDEDEEEDEEEYDDDDEYEDEEYDDEDDDDDDRYDWDLEDDGRRMIIVGIVLALVIVLVAGVGGYMFLNRNKDDDRNQTQTEENEEDEASLIIKGDGPGEDEGGETEDGEDEEQQEEVPEESSEEPEETEEPEPMLMRVNGSSINVRSEANTDSEVLTKVSEGEQVEVLSDPAQEWVQIRCIEQNQEEGYMKSQYLSALE